MKISKCIGLVALLCSSAGMAGTVEVRPTTSGTPLAELGTCAVVTGRCEITINPGTPFSVIVVGMSQPDTAGATLAMTFSPGLDLDWVAADLSTVAPTAGQGFNALVATPNPGTTAAPMAPVAACDNPGDCIITALAPTAGTLPSGTVVAFVLRFTPTGAGPYLIDIIDDGSDFSWSDSVAAPIPNAYTQARVNVIPLPATAWLLAPAILAAGRFSRRRKAA